MGEPIALRKHSTLPFFDPDGKTKNIRFVKSLFLIIQVDCRPP